MSRLPLAEPEQLSGYLSELHDGALDRDWSSRHVARAFAPAPELLEMYLTGFYYPWHTSTGEAEAVARLSPRLKELVRLRIATLNGCKTCKAARLAPDYIPEDQALAIDCYARLGRLHGGREGRDPLRRDARASARPDRRRRHGHAARALRRRPDPRARDDGGPVHRLRQDARGACSSRPWPARCRRAHERRRRALLRRRARAGGTRAGAGRIPARDRRGAPRPHRPGEPRAERVRLPRRRQGSRRRRGAHRGARRRRAARPAPRGAVLDQGAHLDGRAPAHLLHGPAEGQRGHARRRGGAAHA